MKNPKTREDLENMVIESITVDVHCQDLTAVAELISSCPLENLMAYLPEHESRLFKHLKNE